jgi:hypothetical protein
LEKWSCNAAPYDREWPLYEPLYSLQGNVERARFVPFILTRW